jgi:hypothetical protein
MTTPCKENELLLAIQAMEKDLSLSTRSAAKTYSVSRVTLARRLSGTQSRQSTARGARRAEGREAMGGNFVKRLTELRTRFFRRYDYKRAHCENPEVIRGWFSLV